MNTSPNIVLIMVESWDGRVMGNLGDPALKNVTPNFDRFASTGTQFVNSYTPHPICCPARANLWSGQYTFHCKSWNNYKGLEPGVPILPDILREKGKYVLASNKIGIGKHDYLSGNHTNQNRITAWTGAANIELPSYLQQKPLISWGKAKQYHKGDWIFVKQAKKFLKTQIQRQSEGDSNPFFLYLSLNTPHPRFKTNKKWIKKVDYDAISIPPKDEEDHPVLHYQRISKNWKHGLDPDSKRRTRAIYYAMIAETDAFIGEVLDTIQNLGLNDNTYVIITADHGENNMEHDLFYKMNMYESSVRVPLLISGPDVKKNHRLPNLVSSIDLYPTILDMARISKDNAPNKLDGESLMPMIRGETEKSRNWAFSMYTGTAVNTSLFMLRKDQWKYIAYPHFLPQLFNLDEDPDEIHNSASHHPEIVSKMDEDLRQIVDYDAVHKEWQSYCKSAFREYRSKVKAKPIPLFEYGAKKMRATYEEVMANTYKGWTEKHTTQLEEWLESEE